jgi:HPt (histidine-containing phosphotransfer) domain-containing protein
LHYDQCRPGIAAHVFHQSPHDREVIHPNILRSIIDQCYEINQAVTACGILKEARSGLSETDNLITEEPALFIELAELFFDDTPRQLAALRAALESGQAEALRSSAHRLKGSSLTFGAKRMARLCEALETIARTGSVERASNILALLESAFEEVKTQLSHLDQNLTRFGRLE